MIGFNNISPSVRATNVFIELAGIKRSLASLFIPPTIGLIGLYDPLKVETVDYEPVKVLSAEDVGDKAGYGSHSHRQALTMPPSVFLSGGGVYWFPVPDDGGAVVADEDITITGTATSAGTLYFEIGGVLVQVNVADGDADGDVASAIEDAVTAIRDIAVTGSAVLGVCTIASKFKGIAGNELLIKLNPSGDIQEEKAPAGITVALENADGYLAGGTGDPSIEDVFFVAGADKLGDRWYTIFTCPFVDSANLGHIKAAGDLRNDPATHRLFGAYAGYVSKTETEALALPATINKKWIGIIWESRCYAPAFELAAALVGRIAAEQNIAPNRPYKTTEVGLDSDSETPDILYANQDALFRAGMGSCKIGVDGVMRYGDIALTYRTNAGGGPTEEWFDAVTLHLRQAKAYSIEVLFKSERYIRGVVVTNSDVTAYEWAIAPKDIISDLTKLIEELWAPFSWSKNTEQIIADLTAEINSGFEGRLDGQVTDSEAKALRIIAIKYAFLY